MPALLQRFIALIALIILSPFMVIAAAAILLLDGRPLMFNQNRIGQHGKIIKVFKFRTMKNQRITFTGHWLRKTGIDELPQLWNVLLGNMNCVGPRPLTETDVARLGWNTPYYQKRWQVKPGLTGLGQLFAGHSKKLSWAMDNRYVQTTSFVQDVQIMALTLPMQVLGKYRVRKWLFGSKRSKAVYAKSTVNTVKTSRLFNASSPNTPAVKVDWQSWYRTFKRRSQRPDPTHHSATYSTTQAQSDLGLTSQNMKVLLRSMAIFQLGEGGEGRIAKQIETANIEHINNDYRQALKLFVAEEGRHARLLRKAILNLGGGLLSKNWTAQCFLIGRRLMGIRLKLLVLLAAEVVGVTCYRLIASRLPASELKATLYELCDDETVHLNFHCEFFRTQTQSKFRRALFLMVWGAVSLAATLAVFIDHKNCFSALGINRLTFAKKALSVTKQTGRLAIGHVQFEQIIAELRAV